MMTWITLIIEFFKTGLFALGGGLSTIPFLTEMMNDYGWYTAQMLTNMIAISEATPGPIGVNMATYVGFHTTGNILGGVITTLSLITPSIIIIMIIAKGLKKFKDNSLVQNAFYGLRPAVCAMITSAGLGIFMSTMFTPDISFHNILSNIYWIHIILFIIAFLLMKYRPKIHPIVFIISCACLGIILQL